MDVQVYQIILCLRDGALKRKDSIGARNASMIEGYIRGLEHALKITNENGEGD